MSSSKPRWRRRLRAIVALVVLVGVPTAVVGWYKLFRVVAQPEWVTSDPAMRFKYGSFGGEDDSGIPYWIWYVLPRVFPDLMPGDGGYASFGFVWEEGQELPIGFAKKTVGFPRVTNNCAVCHALQYRLREDETPGIVLAGPGPQSNIQAYLRFLSAAANDPRWNAAILLDEIGQVIELSLLDQLLYRFLLIPLTRSKIRERDEQFAWMNRPSHPDWGPGRTDPMNLTKYFLAGVPVDDSVGQSDVPATWNLKIRDGEGMALQWDGATPSTRSVVIDSALGVGASPEPPFLELAEQLHDWLWELPPPKWPERAPAIDEARADRGKVHYERLCASCHDVGSEWMGRVLPPSMVDTDRNRLDSWTQEGADRSNAAVTAAGIDRVYMQKTEGYVPPPLGGVWALSPYLHNGSVPTLRDLLRPAAERPVTFYRGYDLFDPVDVGFVHTGPEAELVGFLLDTRERGNANIGHEYGTELTDAEKLELIEHLKRL